MSSAAYQPVSEGGRAESAEEGPLEGDGPDEYGQDEDELNAKNPREKLENMGAQTWALALGMLSLLLAAYGLHAPLSCVRYPEEEASMPQQCHGLGDTGVTLPDFCWRSCSWGMRKLEMAGWQLLGLLLQTVVVILHHPGCHHFLRLVWYFDPREHIEALQLDGVEDQESGAKESGAKESGAKESGAKKSGAKNFVLHPINSLKAYARQSAQTKVKSAARDFATKLAHQKVQALTCSRAASKASQACLLLAWLRLSIISVTEYSHMTVYFECGGQDGGPIHVEHPPERRWDLLHPLWGAWLCLGIALFMEVKAKWRISVVVMPKSADELRSTLTKMPDGIFAKRMEDMAGGGEDLLARYSNLGAVALHELSHVRYHGRTLSLDKFDGWHLDDVGGAGLVELCFIPKRTKKKLLEMDNKHRKVAMAALAAASFLLFVASTACWSCLRGIQVPENTSHLHLDKWLLLMGSCGRHADVGLRCFLGCMLIFLAVAQQVVIFKCCEQAVDSLDALGKNDRRQQLMLPIADYRKVRVLDGDHYEKAGVDLPDLKCHVWVRQGTDGEEPVHFESFEKQSKMTKSWERSEVPYKVKLTTAKVQQVADWKYKLHRDDTNMPSVHIAFRDEKSGVDCEQIVPPEFVTGFFHAWVNLGPKLAWEKMSAFLAFCGAALAGYDIAVFELSKHGQIMTSCNEVRNSGRCIYMGLHDVDSSPFVFRRSVGMFIAALGCLLALMGVLGLRVACKHPKAMGCSCCEAYARAMLYCFFGLPYQMLRGAAGALCMGCAQGRRKSSRNMDIDMVDTRQRLLE